MSEKFEDILESCFYKDSSREYFILDQGLIHRHFEVNSQQKKNIKLYCSVFIVAYLTCGASGFLILELTNDGIFNGNWLVALFLIFYSSIEANFWKLLIKNLSLEVTKVDKTDAEMLRKSVKRSNNKLMLYVSIILFLGFIYHPADITIWFSIIVSIIYFIRKAFHVKSNSSRLWNV
jgi:hypothetical protein